MTRSIDFTVIDNLRVSASRGQHAHVIQETIVIDNELQNLQLHLLDLRARSYVACAKFNNALETATKMQQINPATALGYLSQGYIHMEQGRYIAATHVYDTALERVDKHDPLYDTIHTAKAKAMQQGEKRTDFICDLPMDISDRVIKEVLQHGVYDQQREYVMVSSAWWHRIMATDRLEYIIRGGLPLTESSEAVIQSFEHTRSLTLKYCKQPLGDLFKKYPFSSLTTLAVYASKIGPFGESISALQWIGSQQDYGVRLQYVLKMCPNLKSLHCEATIYISRIEEVYSKLKRLILYGVRGRVDREQMRMMRDHLPGLKTLEMAITDSSKPLTMDDSWLPCICHLGYSDRPNTDHLDYVQRQSGEQEGLVSFSITDINYQFPLDDIAPIIIHHHATLQYLEFMSNLNTTDTRKMMDAMKKDQHIEFKQLKVLQVYTLFTPFDLSTIQPFCSFINWVIERAPYLQLADLKGYTMNRSSLKALSKCMHLRHVGFQVHETQRPDDYDTLLADFLKDHVNYASDKGGSRLESMDIHLYEAHPNLIDAIKGLPCLHSLNLIVQDLESEPFTQLFDSLRQGCQGLKHLFLRTPGTIPNPILYHISGLPNLRILTMAGDLRGADAGVLSLQRCPHLRRIIHYRPIEDEIRSMLLNSNPRLHISYAK